MRYPIRFSGSFSSVPEGVLAAAEAALAAMSDDAIDLSMSAMLVTADSLRQLDIAGWRFVYRINARSTAVEVLAASELGAASPG